jgi:hypothetical protein
VCLPGSSVHRRSYLQRELRKVLGVADDKPDGTVFVIPGKLESCGLTERIERVTSWSCSRRTVMRA